MLRPTLIEHGLTAGVAVVYLVYLLVVRRLPGGSALDAPAGALVIIYGTAIALSIYPRVSFEASLVVATALVAFYVCHDLPATDTNMVARGFVVSGAVVSVVALYHVGVEYLHWLDLVRAVDGSVDAGDILPPTLPRVTGVGGHVNSLAMALNLVLPFAVALALTPQRRFDRVLGASTTVLLLLSLLFTVSRGAWLGTAVALVVFAALYAVRARREHDQPSTDNRLRRWRPLLAGMFVLGVLALAAVVALTWDARPDFLFRASLSPREDALSAGWEIFRDAPFFGAGPYTYSLLYDTYSGKFPIENIHPHNGYVAVLVDLGAAGALVLAWGGIALLLGLWRAYRNAAPADRTLIAAVVAGLASLAVHSLLDSPNSWLTALLPLAVVLAIGARLAPSPRPHRFVTPLRVAPVLVVLVMLAGWFYIDRAHIAYDDSLNLLNEAALSEATTRAHDAANRDGTNAAYHVNAATLAAIEYIVAPARGETADPVLIEGAISHLQRAAKLDPRSAVAYLNLALAYRQVDDPGNAVEAARTALALAGGDGSVGIVAGSVLEWADLPDEALDAYAFALSHDAGLVQSPFWGTTPERFEMRDQALSASTLTDCEKGRVSAIYRGFDDDLASWERGCRARVDADPGDARARSDLAIILFALGRRDDARRQSEDAVARVPDSKFARTALAVTSGGDIDRVRHELMLAAYLGDPDAALLLAYTYGVAPADNPVVENLSLPVEAGELPKPVVRLLRKSVGEAAPFVYDAGAQRYLLGILYYRVSYLRESPSTIIIPDEWLLFASPRALFILEALRGP